LPIYEYQCAACGAVRDIKHGFKESTAEVCSSCSGALKRIFRPAGIVFKGSGFYVTDSRKGSGNGKPDAAPAKTDGTPEKSDGAPAKTDSSAPTGESGGLKGEPSKAETSKPSTTGKGDAAA
jgi:putative FmdB family regulatory protein